MQTKVRDLTKSRESWKERAIRAEQAIKQGTLKQEQPNEAVNSAELSVMDNGTAILTPSGHHYSVPVIQLAIQQVVEGLASFRCVQRSFELFSQFINIQTPGFASIRTWVFRLGLYNLRENIEFRSDWIIVFDHTIELGQVKCLLTLGISREQFKQKTQRRDGGISLCHFDMTVLDINAMSRCNGEVIKQKLDDLTMRIGTPVQIVSDNGSDLKKGVDFYKQQHPKVIHTYDVTHKMAIFIKKELNTDDRYMEFSKKCTQTANEIRQTALSFLKPAQDRTKSRYLN